jgi:hypothetical protein
MEDNPSRLELLPNEILDEVFQYLDAGDLFRAFNNLNSRFNALLRSQNHLFLSVSTSDPHEIDNSHIFSHYIHILIVGRDANIKLKNFPNLRRLKFLNPTCEQLDGLDAAHLPDLKHLSVGYASFCNHSLDAYRKRNHCTKVFSNGFPSLISCYLFHPETMSTLVYFNQSTQLRILRVGSTSLFNYQKILSACPNLYFFQLTFPHGYVKPAIMKSHFNLRRMIIDFHPNTFPLNDYDLDDYLSCVPNLEQLCIYRQNEDGDMIPYFDYNWLAESIHRHLPLLRRFKYYFRIYFAAALIDDDDENILSRLEEGFKYVHNRRYQSKLVFKLYPYAYID